MGLQSINPQRREALLEWVGDYPEGVTVQEVADQFAIHYQTAHDWLAILMRDKQVSRIEGGKPFRYITLTSRGSGPLTVRWGDERVTLGEYGLGVLENTTLPNIGGAITYLIVRSYYADYPDQAHLRGVVNPLEVREMFVQQTEMLRRHLAIAESLLALRAPWIEGPTLAMRAAPSNIVKAVEVAQQFSRAVQKRNSLTSEAEAHKMKGQEANDEGE